MGANGLSTKRERFVQEFLVDLNGTQAAIRAGYSPKTANEQAPRLLANASVAAAIAARQNKIAKRLEVTAERIVLEYARLAFVDPRSLYDEAGKLVPITELPEDVTRAISEVWVGEEGTRRIKLASKQAALDSLARHLGMFIDRSLAVNANVSIADLARLLHDQHRNG